MLRQHIQCGADETRSFSHTYSQRTPHISPVRARYRECFVILAFDWYSASVLVITFLAYWTGPRYNGTRLCWKSFSVCIYIFITHFHASFVHRTCQGRTTGRIRFSYRRCIIKCSTITYCCKQNGYGKCCNIGLIQNYTRNLIWCGAVNCWLGEQKCPVIYFANATSSGALEEYNLHRNYVEYGLGHINTFVV